MDGTYIHITNQEVNDLVHLLLDAIDIADGAEPTATWTAQVWEQALMLVNRRDLGGSPSAN